MDCVAPGSHYASRTGTIPDESLDVVAPRGSWPAAPGSAGGRTRIVCCASSRLLRSLTLRCASSSRAVEGQGAQQREKGVADAGEPVGEQSDWCGWGSWDSPGRGRVQICCKGAPGRDRPRIKARNINDSLPALRRDPGLCNRFGQLDVADPCADGGLGDHPGLRAGPPRPLGRRNVHFAPERAPLTAPLESRMHISRAKCTSRRAQDRSAPPPRTAPARATPTHGPRLPVRKAQWDGVSHVVTRPVHLDHKWSSGRAPPRARRRPRDDPHHRPLNSLPDLRRPKPACVMRAQRNAIHPASRRAGSARHDPPALDPREPTWRNAT